MISISVYKQSNYPVSAKKIKDILKITFEKHGISSDAEVSVAIVSEKRIEEYVNKYMGEFGEEARAHPVLSFPVNELEKPFVFPPDKLLHLGEIVVSYPRAVDEAKNTSRLLDEVVCNLAVHGALHLMGIHHD